MLNLVLKDIRLIKKMLILAIVYGGIIIAASLNVSMDIGNIMYCFFIICMTYLSVLYADGYDERNKGYLVMASLPVERSMLVISKYLSFFVYFAIYSVIPYIILPAVSVFTPNGFHSYSLYVILASFIVIGFLYSIYYPLYYRFGYNALRVYKIFLFVFIMILPKLTKSTMNTALKIGLGDYRILIAILGLMVLAICYGSCRISMRFYKNKELI